ncbi:MAG: toprim domain-containing protein [Alphaproteobacteria bacterium]|nr:toprim domain-containing protein [Alphaproteobacteria bacterium]MCB9931433.1 toprim domain-containing protein [Alphaproteobacteria bacterium]
MTTAILERADAQSLTKALGGRWYGHYGTCPCPVCQPERRRDQNALTLADSRGRLLLHCKKSQCTFRDVLAAAGVAPGSHAAPDPVAVAQLNAERQAVRAESSRFAERIWREARPIHGTLGERYLRTRGIDCELPGTLRYLSACWHTPSKMCWPAVVALVQGGDGFAVHRIYLDRDGTGKAPVGSNDQKRALGPVRGGAVRLTVGRGPLVIAEGIETALSAIPGGFVEPDARIWAAISSSNMKQVKLPRTPGRLVVALDRDQAGRRAAYALADRAHGWAWEVTLLQPPAGSDFNDLLRREVAA